MRQRAFTCLVLLLPLAGCTGLTGTYERADQKHTDPPGSITVLTLDADGYYTQTVTGPAPRTTTGSFTIRGDMLTLRAAAGGAATYRMKRERDDLLLTPVDAPGTPGIAVRLVRTGSYGTR